MRKILIPNERQPSRKLSMAEYPLTREIDDRNGGCGVVFEDKLYVWGGETTDKFRPYELMDDASDDSDDDDDESGENEDDVDLVIERVTTLPRPNDPNHPFDVFDMQTRSWSRQPTGGDHPLLGLGSSLNVHPESRSFYLCTGWNDGKFDSEVYRIPVDSWNWEIVEPVTDVKPSPRYSTGTFIHEDRLCMFGGVGPEIKKDQDPGGRYIKYPLESMEFGLNNEYYEFDIGSRSWTAPLGCDAVRPEPMSGMGFSKVDQHRAMLFGGKTIPAYMNEMFVFDLDRKTFSGPIRSSWPGQPWPIGRRFLTFTPLVNPEKVGQKLCGCGPVLKQKILLLWGKKTKDLICSDTWLMEADVESNVERYTCTWTQLSIDTKPRAWYIARPVYNQQVSTECQIVLFGGNEHVVDNMGDRMDIAQLRILTFGVKSLVSCCLSAVVASEQLMVQLPSLPHKLQSQIKNAHVTKFHCLHNLSD